MKKKPSQAEGGHEVVFRGAAAAAAFLGTTEKAVYQAVFRGRIPHKRWGARLVFLQTELLQFMHGLPGTTVEEARASDERRVQ